MSHSNVEEGISKVYGMEVPQKIKWRIIICPSNSTTGYIPKGIETEILNKYLYTNVHHNIVLQ